MNIEKGQVSSTFLMCIFVLCIECLLVFLYTQPQCKMFLSFGIPENHIKDYLQDSADNQTWLLFFSLSVIFLLMFKFAIVTGNAKRSSFLYTRTICELAILLILQVSFVKFIVLPVYAKKYYLLTGKKFDVPHETPDIEKRIWFLPIVMSILGVVMVLINGAVPALWGILFHSLATFITEAIVLYILHVFMLDFSSVFEEPKKGGFLEYMMSQIESFPVLCLVLLCGMGIVCCIVFAFVTRQFTFLFQVLITLLSYGVIVYYGTEFKLMKNIEAHARSIEKKTAKEVLEEIILRKRFEEIEMDLDYTSLPKKTQNV